MENLLEIARRYLRSIENGAEGETLANFFAPGVIQEEFPNRLNPDGARRNLDDLLQAAIRGKKVISSQHYEIVSEIAGGNGVTLEVIWTGTLSVPLGSLSPGDTMRAHFAVFLDFQSGKIISQRNYDCFDPW